jgi:hypothetical protein
MHVESGWEDFLRVLDGKTGSFWVPERSEGRKMRGNQGSVVDFLDFLGLFR